MAQQINLHSPILLTPRRYFSALAMVQALGALVLGLSALALYAAHTTQAQRQELATAAQLNQADRQRLQAQLATQPALPSDTQALQQELAAARLALANSQRVHHELVAPPEQARRAAVLLLLARTAPPALWLTEVRLADQRIELAGQTLQPELLRPWLAGLQASPALGGLALRSVKVEHRAALAGEAPAWAFRVFSGDAGSGPNHTGRAGAPP